MERSHILVSLISLILLEGILVAFGMDRIVIGIFIYLFDTVVLGSKGPCAHDYYN